MELSERGKGLLYVGRLHARLLFAECFVVKGYGVVGDGLQAHATDGTVVGAEIGLQQRLGQADGLEYLSSPIAADGGYAHLRHYLEQALLHGLYVVGFRRGVVFLYLALLHEVVEDGVGHVGAESRRAIAQEKGGVHHLAYLARLDDKGCLYALSHGDEVMVDGAHRQQRWDGDMRGVDVAVGEDDVVVALVDTLLGVVAKAVERVAQTTLTLFGLKDHGQLDGVETLVAYVAQNVELGVGEDGVGKAHHLAVRLVGIEDSCSHATDVLGEAHDEILADGVDGGVGNLRELLAEIVEEDLRAVAEHGKRRVVAHRGRGLLALHGHGNDGVFDVLTTEAKLHTLALEVVDGVAHLASAAYLLELDAVGVEPLAVRMLVGQSLANLAIVVDLALLGIDEQNLSGLQTTLLGDLRGVEVHDADLRRHHHRVVLGDGVARWAQTVAVEHAAGETSVGEEQGGRAVPRLHEDGVVLIEGLQVFGYGVLVVEALGNHDRHGMGQRQAAHDEELEHVVEARRVAHARLYDGRDAADVAQRLARQHRLARLHPSAVAPDGVDLTVVGHHAEGLRQAPRGECVGGEATVDNGQATGEVVVGEVGIVLPQLQTGEHALVDDALARQRAYVEVVDGHLGMLGTQLGHAVFNLLAYDV